DRQSGQERSDQGREPQHQAEQQSGDRADEQDGADRQRDQAVPRPRHAPRRNRPVDADLRLHEGAAVLGEPAEQLAYRFVFGLPRIGQAQAPSFAALRPPELSSRPVLISRTSMKPATAAMPMAMPGLLRTKSRVSSIRSSTVRSRNLSARPETAPEARCAYSP